MGNLPCAACLQEKSPRGFRAAVLAVKCEVVAQQFTFKDTCFSGEVSYANTSLEENNIYRALILYVEYR